MFTKKKEKQPKEKKPRIYKVNRKWGRVIALWVLLAVSFGFAVYRNFTAVNTHTVHETKIIEEKMIDTNSIENFVINFAKVYYSWDKTAESIDNRMETLKYYLTPDLHSLNADVVRKDIPVSSSIMGAQIWNVEKSSDNEYDVTFTVHQSINDDENTEMVASIYEVTVYVDNNGDMVIIKNPTITNKPATSSYEPKRIESNGSIDMVEMAELNEFLETFFKLYPNATEKELTYYVSAGALPTIGKDYFFAELINPVYDKEGGKVIANVSVKFLDDLTKTAQISQFVLTLEKLDGNWRVTA